MQCRSKRWWIGRFISLQLFILQGPAEREDHETGCSGKYAPAQINYGPEVESNWCWPRGYFCGFSDWSATYAGSGLILQALLAVLHTSHTCSHKYFNHFYHMRPVKSACWSFSAYKLIFGVGPGSVSQHGFACWITGRLVLVTVTFHFITGGIGITVMSSINHL